MQRQERRSNTALYYSSHCELRGLLMSQDQQPRPWWSEHWLLLVLVALAVVLAVLVGLGYGLRWSWTGFTGSGVSPPKLIWDWLELLIIPIVLGAGAFWFNTQTRKSEQEIAQRERVNDRQIADDRVREDALQRYLDRMQELILDKGLRRSEKDAEIRNVACARTLAVLRGLDGNRKGQVVRFLHETDLIGKIEERQVIETIIDLRTADLERVDLRYADLRGADLRGADLRDADLSIADLDGANLWGAFLGSANLIFAKLRGANLENTGLDGADLHDADLRGANLRGAILVSVAEEQTEERINEQLAQAGSLVGAILPDGTVIKTEEAWEEFKKRYR
jgi:uncharacterized protein YjbI with pentapeptide repeats